MFRSFSIKTKESKGISTTITGLLSFIEKNKSISAPFASKYSRLRICEQLNKGKPQAAVPVICATKHLLSQGLAGRPPALRSFISPRQVCIFRHDIPLCAFYHKRGHHVIIYICQQRKVFLSPRALPDISKLRHSPSTEEIYF